MSSDRSAALKLVTELADDRAGAERRFNLGIAAARATGAPVVEIARAGRLSTSRVNAILEQLGRPFQPPSDDDAHFLPESAFTVGLVPAGHLALSDYDDYSAYICQPKRSFRDEMARLGFYARGEISPYFPLIREVWESVPFSAEEVEQRRASGDPASRELADIIERVLAAPRNGDGRAGRHCKVFLLTPRGHDHTLTLPHPIKHLQRGRGQAFVRKQRYTTPAALLREPKTTGELVRFERS
jgi:hypothetical protein